MSTTVSPSHAGGRRKLAAPAAKAAAPRPKKAAGSARKKPKSSLDARLKVLKTQLRGADGKIAKARRREEEVATEQQKARVHVLRLTSEKKSLQDTIAAVSVQRTAIAKERDAAEADLKDALADRGELRKQVRRDRRSAAIKGAIAEVDAKINEQSKKVAEIEKQAAGAQREFDAAAKRVAELEARRRGRQEELRTLPDRIREARGQVAKLGAAMKTAAAAGRAWEVHSLEDEVGDAIAELQKQTDRKKETALIDTVLDAKKLTDAKDKAESQAKTLADHKERLLAAKTELATRKQQRQKSIREKLDPGSK